MAKLFFIKCLILYCVITSAQVHVRDEPRHHNVFENEFFRILDVYLAPGDTTQYHLHNTPSVFILLNNCKVSSQLLGGQPQAGANVAGIISYDSLNTPRIHRVWNTDTVWFHVIDIELTGKNQNGTTNLLQDPLLKLLFDKREANGYRFDLKPGDKLELPAASNGYLLVSLNNSVIDIKIQNSAHRRTVKAGHYEWIESSKALALNTTDGATGKFVLLQLK